MGPMAEAKALIIVESPAKARTISRFLGPEDVVESSIGHIRDLPPSAAEIPKKHKGKKWARLGIDVESDVAATTEVLFLAMGSGDAGHVQLNTRWSVHWDVRDDQDSLSAEGRSSI